MKIHEISVTNLNDYKSKKASNELTAKLQNLANDFPNIIANQNEQEKWFNGELDKIMHDIDKPFRPDRMLFAHVAKDYSDDTTILDLLYFNADDNQIIADYIRKNFQKLVDAIIVAKSKIKKLEAEADKLKWAAPFRRYTKLGFVLTHLDAYLSMFTRTIKR